MHFWTSNLLLRASIGSALIGERLTDFVQQSKRNWRRQALWDP